MKNILKKFFVLAFILLGKLDVFAKPNPPAPSIVAKTADDPELPPPPGLPIDDHILFLLILGMLLGIYIVYRYQLKTKAPIV